MTHTHASALGASMFDTHDIYLAGFLAARNHPVQVVPDGPRHRFAFASAVSDDMVDYHRGGLVEGRAFAAALVDIKSRIHAPRSSR